VIEVDHSERGIYISQQKYIIHLLKETCKIAHKPANTPIVPNIKLGNVKEDIAMDEEMYQKLLDSFIYLSYTRPDIAFGVSLISQYMHQPNEAHL